MKYIGIAFVLSLIFLGCQSADASQAEALRASQARIGELEEEMSNIVQRRGKILTHDVYFDLKDDLPHGDRSRFEAGLRSLSGIKVAKGLKVGRVADTGDQRLVSDYDFVLSMYFEKLEDLEKYAKDSFHLEVRKEVGPMLEKKPVVYDSWVE